MSRPPHSGALTGASLLALGLVWGLASGPAAASAPATPTPAVAPAPAPIVYFDIAGPDVDKLRSFYSGVFGWKIGPSNLIGRDSTGVLDGTLRQDPAAKILYLGVPDVTAALKAAVAAGGAIIQPRLVVPGVVVLGLFTDPAGNPMGVVEMKDGKPVIPPARP